MVNEIQQGNVVFVEELGKECVHFICEHCEKEIYKPVVYIRDPRVALLGRIPVILHIHHQCCSRLNFTDVKFDRIK
jgi:hypothetical protein